MLSDIHKFFIDVCGERMAHFLLGALAIVAPCAYILWTIIKYLMRKYDDKIEQLNGQLIKCKLDFELQESEAKAERRVTRRLKAKLEEVEATKESEIEAAERKHAELTKKLEHADQASAEAVQKNEALSLQLRESAERCAALSAKIQLLDEQLTKPNEAEAILRRQVRELENAMAARKSEIDRMGGQLEQLQRRIDSEQNATMALGAQLQESESARSTLGAEIVSLQQKIEESSKLSLQPTNSSRGEAEKPVLPLEELRRCWEKSVDLPNAPRFRPAKEPAMRIVSILNLKGGVGKTTITANLGATLWRDGQKVLLVDLDFQGSLTARCLAETPEERSVEYFFNNAATAANLTAELKRLVQPISLDKWGQRMLAAQGRGYLLAADEPLADVETSLMVRWLFGDGPDVRFLLRRALHNSVLDGVYDCVLVDCPPRLTTACVNAIACSDSVLIPLVLDETAAERVPFVLKRLSRLRDIGVCPNLHQVAVIANMVGRTKREQSLWKNLQGSWEHLWEKDKIYFVQQQIFDDSEIGVAADLHFPAVMRRTQNFDDLRTAFNRISEELRQEGFLK